MSEADGALRYRFATATFQQDLAQGSGPPENPTENMGILGKPFHRWRTKALLGSCTVLILIIYFSDNSTSDESSIYKNRDKLDLSEGNNGAGHVRTLNLDDSADDQHRVNANKDDGKGSIGGVKLPIEHLQSANNNEEKVNNGHAPNHILGEKIRDDIEDEESSLKSKNAEEIKRTKEYHDIWIEADRIINNKEIFQENSHVDKVLDAMRTARIVHIEVLDLGDYESGTSEKWVGVLEGGQKVMVKLVWPGEKKGTMKKDAACNYGFEFPTAEVAAFHMHRLLGYRNTVYVTGRRIDIEKELIPAASPQVAKQFKEIDGKACVLGKCFFCKNYHRLCPSDGIVDASIAYWVPRHLKLYTYPPKYMPYSTPRGDEWDHIGFNNRTYCKKTRKIHPYEFDRYYHDLFDFSVLDFLMYHYDSKHYIIKDGSDAHGLTVRLDHGRAFCANDRDDEHIFLAPLFQCCTLRRSMYERLKVFSGGALSRRLRASLAHNPIAPVLEEKWFRVLDKRYRRIMVLIQQCAKANGGFENILVDDGF